MSNNGLPRNVWTRRDAIKSLSLVFLGSALTSAGAFALKPQEAQAAAKKMQVATKAQAKAFNKALNQLSKKIKAFVKKRAQPMPASIVIVEDPAWAEKFEDHYDDAFGIECTPTTFAKAMRKVPKAIRKKYGKAIKKLQKKHRIAMGGGKLGVSWYVGTRVLSAKGAWVNTHEDAIKLAAGESATVQVRARIVGDHPTVAPAGGVCEHAWGRTKWSDSVLIENTSGHPITIEANGFFAFKDESSFAQSQRDWYGADGTFHRYDEPIG